MSTFNGWKYYKHAVVPDVAPDVNVDTSCIESGEVWKCKDGEVILARWTTDFDCGYETNWWYEIKDTVFDINSLPSKKRYKINRGHKHFDVRLIDPKEYKQDIYDVQVDAYKDYPAKYRPFVDKDKVYAIIDNDWKRANVKIYAAFEKESGRMAGYIQLDLSGNCIESIAQKAKPEFEKFQVNYAMLHKVIEDHNESISKGCYICVGARNIQHETAFQQFVEEIFDFRKAYCKLHVEYNPKYKWIIKLIYPFRRIIKCFDDIGIVHKVNGILAMEEIVRTQ